MPPIPDSADPLSVATAATTASKTPVVTSPFDRFFGPTPPLVTAEFAARSHPGKVRKNNEDHYLVERHRRRLDVLLNNLPFEFSGTACHDEDAYVLAVADGMGGVAFGELASALALRTGMDLVLSAVKWSMKFSPSEMGELEDKMDAYFSLIDQTLIERAWSEPRLAGMGTTLTIAYTAGPEVFIGHAGDSRAYRMRAGQLSRLTHDHTLAQDLADRGAIDQREVPTHRLRNTLTNYLGGPREGVDPDFIHTRLVDNDILLLCSDGLTDMIGDDVIAATMAKATSLDAAAEALVERALDAGGRDNITVVIGRYGVPDVAETGDFPAIPSSNGA